MPTVLTAAAPVSTETVARVLVSPCAFRRWWFAIVTTHCVCGVFLGYAGAAYLFLDGSSLAVDFAIYSMTVSEQYYRPIAGVYFALASVHALLVVHHVVQSVQARRFVFRMPRSKLSPSSSVRVTSTSSTRVQSSASLSAVPAPKVASIRQSSSVRTERLESRRASSMQQPLPVTTSRWRHLDVWRRSLHVVTQLWTLLRALAAPFDVRHKHYGVVFLLRELVLTFLQSVQTYRLSRLATQIWMNNLMVALLVLNCWATPLLQYVLGARVGHVRLCGAAVNLVLDMVSYIVLPLALLAPYMRDFNYDIKQFDRVLWYTDKALVGLINEVQLVFVTSLYDAVSKFLIVLSVARGLYAATKLLCTADMVGPGEVATTCSTAKVDAAPASATSVGSMTSALDQHDDHRRQGRYFTVSLKAVDLSSPRALQWRSRIETLGHYVLLAWGLTVLLAHLYATSRPDYSQCRVPTYPWFSSKPSCSLLEINCVEERTRGCADDIDRILRVFEPSRVEYLVIRHCAALQVPSRLQSLTELLGLKLFNVTIQDWRECAALTETHHPKLRFLFIVNVQMAGLPMGLQSRDFPRRLRDVEFSRTNLSVVPETLDTIWPRGMFVAFEECQLQEVPRVVMRMQPQDLALSMNNISELPAELFETTPLRVLLLDGNPLTMQSFPHSLMQQPEILLIGLVGTQVSELPSWIDADMLASTYVVAGDTPLCRDKIAADEASEFAPLTLMGERGRVDCSYGLISSSTLNWYPVDDEATINPSYTLV